MLSSLLEKGLYDDETAIKIVAKKMKLDPEEMKICMQKYFKPS